MRLWVIFGKFFFVNIDILKLSQSAVSRSSLRSEKIARENRFELIEQNAWNHNVPIFQTFGQKRGGLKKVGKNDGKSLNICMEFYILNM